MGEKKGLLHMYVKVISFMMGSSNHRKEADRMTLEKNVSGNFRLSRNDMKIVCKELEKSGYLKRVNRDRYRLKDVSL